MLKRIALSVILPPLLIACIAAACGPDTDEADDESTQRVGRGIGTSPSANAVQDAGPDASEK